MPGQVHSNRTRTPQETQNAEMDALVDDAVKEASDKSGSVTADVATDWLDSIDEALEEWAESDEMAKAFIAAYVQKGGQ